jgi:hypothetical protein
LIGGDHDVAGVAAVPQQPHGPIAGAPVGDVPSHPLDGARDLEARAEGAGRNRPVEADAHHQVREVHAARVDPEVHLVRPRIGERDVTLHEGLGRAELVDEYRARGGHPPNVSRSGSGRPVPGAGERQSAP